MSRLAGIAMGTAATLALSGFTPAWAQSPSELPFMDLSQVQAPIRQDSGFAVMAHVRFGGVTGNVDEDLGLDYHDLFHEGFGFELEAEWSFPTGADFLGPYVTLGWDTFDGKSADDDAGGIREPDRLDIWSVMAGVKWKSFLKNWHGEEDLYAVFRLGIGAASNRAVGGTLIVAGVSSTVDVFDASTVFAFEIGCGMKQDFGRLYIDVNVDFRFQQPMDSEELDFGSSTAMVVALVFGLGFDF